MNKYDKITPEGTRDALFSECTLRRQIENRLLGLFTSRGYSEIITPTLEFYDVFNRASQPFPMEKMYKKGIYFCPTINFLPAWLATYPPQYIPGVHDKYEGATLVDKELARLYDNVNKAYKMGVIITTGSDSFNLDSTPYGITTIGEIHRFVDCCGMSEMDAIIAGTANGARALGCYHITGSITRGKNADMLLIDGDPLKSIYDICVEKMEMVIKDGEEILRYRDKK